MKTNFSIVLAALAIGCLVPAFAMAAGGGHDHMQMAQHNEEKPATRLEVMPSREIEAGKTVTLNVKVIDKAGKLLGSRDLKTVHTRKLHLLVVDPSLTDYHHLHPKEVKNGEWVVEFTPGKSDSYRIWADIFPVRTASQQYIYTDIGSPSPQNSEIDKTEKLAGSFKDYNFTLALDGGLKAGEATMANITVTKDGKPFKQLQPVMGAFAHVVGFGEDYKAIMHIHPMGKEPKSEAERGGNILEFHIEPEKAGFVKLFAQFRIDGEDVFVPFGVTVK